ncbi:MAG: VOC family protein [Micropruina sp.]|uniref:VOC family protein n=1 Tax=Micropruina sp. TaxID=2737536 RepID=UPI0039E55176
MTELLPGDTRMGRVSLDVADLDAMTAFYRDVLLLQVRAERSSEIDLGRGDETLVALRHRPDLPKGERRSAGLFHTAILHADRASLAATLVSVAIRTPELYTGAGDHLVSQAFYLDDPEGNGVELYWDRPRSEWHWQDGRVLMDTLFVDAGGFIGAHLTDAARDYLSTVPDRRGVLAGLDGTVGHVHLKVGDAELARRFYVDLLGFELTAEVPGAVFVSAGGYHHHMAMNTWRSDGVGLRAPGLGLGRVDITLPDAAEVARAAARLRPRGVQLRDTSATVEFDDPWGNLVRLTSAPRNERYQRST